MERKSIAITTDASGDGIGYISSPQAHGFFESFRYVKTDYADGVGVAITGETSGLVLLTIPAMNASVEAYPQARVSKRADGADAEVAAGFPVRCRIPIANERIKVVVSAGGNVKIGTFHIWIG